MKRIPPFGLALIPIVLGAASAALWSGPATAQAGVQPERYVGAAIGAATRYDLDCSTGTRCDRSPSGSAKVTLGLRLEKHFGAELMAWRLASGDGSVRLGTGVGPGSVRSQGVAAVGVFSAPLLDAWSAQARLGVGQVRGTVVHAGGATGRTSRATPVFGLGLRYALTPQWSVSADWDRLPTRVDARNKVDADLLSIGLQWHF